MTRRSGFSRSRLPAAVVTFLLAHSGGASEASIPLWVRSEAPATGCPVEITMELAGGAAYRKQDIELKFSLKNQGEAACRFDESAFGPGSFTISDAAGRPPGPAAPPDPGEALEVPGYGTMERRVNLSRFHPKLARKRKLWQVTWRHGDRSVGPLPVIVIEPHRPGKDREAVVRTDMGTMIWQFLPEHAPKHVRRFVDLARQGYYDGLSIHKAIPAVMAIGGAPGPDGSGGWERLLEPEIATKLSVPLGMVGAMREDTSMTSEVVFFVTLAPADYMLGKQTFYARVTQGIDLVARINRLENRGDTGLKDAYLLLKPIRIESISIR
ncbi:MAG TPA: peptidylprolyl isomerase [Candidatus Polarisedimenticolia bacterium]|nr:peptidylprolyl isomerase [Candidatus Polarisedimenticolia bacterium]